MQTLGMDNTLKGKLVLLVEDDATYAKLWQRLLKEMGVVHVFVVESSEEAMALLKAQSFDLLISDVTLPGINGYELSRQARTLHPALKVLLTTGYQTDLSRFDLKSPRFHLLHKPYHNLELILKLAAQLLSDQKPQDAFDEDSFSENEDYPDITEWTL